MSLEDLFKAYIKLNYRDAEFVGNAESHIREAFYAGVRVARESKNDFALDLEYKRKEVEAGIV